MSWSAYKFILKPFFYFWDLSFIFLAFFISYYIRFDYHETSFLVFLNSTSLYKNVLIFSLILWLVISVILNMQHVPHRKSNEQIWKYFYYPQLFFCFFIFLYLVVTNFDSVSRLFILYFILIQFILLLLARVIRVSFIRKIRTSGYNSIQLLFLGDQKIYQYFENWAYKNPWYGINIFKFQLHDEDSRNEYLNAVRKLKIGDYLVVDIKFLEINNLQEVLIIADNNGVNIFELIDSKEALVKSNLKFELVSFGTLKLIHRRLQPLKKSINQINKRFFDFIFSFLFLILVFWWIAIIIAFVIKLTSPGPIFFRQERTGKDGKIFFCIKFRTMTAKKIDLSNTITQINDTRIYPFGQFLRKYNLDELPQFINVFFGEMSIVGPRPHMIEEDNKLAKNLVNYRIRHWVRPGITGLAAVKGLRGGTENMRLMQSRIDYDIKYIETWTLLNDIRICLLTAYQMFSGNTNAH